MKTPGEIAEDITIAAWLGKFDRSALRKAIASALVAERAEAERLRAECTTLADMSVRRENEIAKLRLDLALATEGLTEIAAFGDETANCLLDATGKYHGFDEPGSVETARSYLGGLSGVGQSTLEAALDAERAVVTRLTAERDDARRDLAEAVEVLRPFAAVADGYDTFGTNQMLAYVYLARLRAARAFLSRLQSTEKTDG